MRTLYRLADRGILKKEDLPWKDKRKPNGHSEKRGKQALRRDLRERADSYPNFKTELGHLERDTIVGEKHKSAVITLVERCTKAIITLKTNGWKASDVEASINQWLSHVPSHLFKSITFDCGKELLIGNLFRMHMTLIFSLRIQDVLGNEVSMNILMAY